MHRNVAAVSCAATLAVSISAHAQDAATTAPPPQPTTPPAASAPPPAPKAESDETPVDYYRKMSFSLVSGMDFVTFLAPYGWTGLATQFGPGGADGILGLSASARFVYSGIVIGAQFGAFYVNGITAKTILYPGLSIGYAIPLMERLALTPSFHTEFLLSTASNSSAVVQLTGEVGLEVFLGKHGYIEPVISMGDLQDTGAGTSGQATFIFGVGYRLGVVF